MYFWENIGKDRTETYLTCQIVLNVICLNSSFKGFICQGWGQGATFHEFISLFVSYLFKTHWYTSPILFVSVLEWVQSTDIARVN